MADYQAKIGGYWHPISYDYSTDGGSVWKWLGVVPSCPSCGEALAYNKKRLTVHVGDRRGDFIAECGACDFVFGVVEKT